MLVEHGGGGRRGSRQRKHTMKGGGDKIQDTLKAGQQWRQ